MRANVEVTSDDCPRCSRQAHLRLLSNVIAAGYPDSGSSEPARVPEIKRSLNVLMKLRLDENDIWDPPARSALRRFRDQGELSESLAGDRELSETRPSAPATLEYFNGVFEGGAAKGTAFLGALAYMENHHMWFKRVAGTSAGAITAALVAAGYSVRNPQGGGETLHDIISKTNFKDVLMDAPSADSFSEAEIERSLLFRAIPTPGIAKSLAIKMFRSTVLANSAPARIALNFMERGGLFAGEVFRAWLNRKLRDRLQTVAGPNALSAEPTFRELVDRTRISLSVIAADLADGHVVVFNEDSTPNVSVATAVRMSMSVPLLFTAVPFQGCMLVDGGTLLNFPMVLFTRDNPFLKNDPASLKRRNLGLLLEETKTPIPRTLPCTPAKIVTGQELILKQIAAWRRSYYPQSQYAKDIMSIDVSDVDPFAFDITEARKCEIAQRGWVAAEKYFGVKDANSPYRDCSNYARSKQ